MEEQLMLIFTLQKIQLSMPTGIIHQMQVELRFPQMEATHFQMEVVCQIIIMQEFISQFLRLNHHMFMQPLRITSINQPTREVRLPHSAIQIVVV